MGCSGLITLFSFVFLIASVIFESVGILTTNIYNKNEIKNIYDQISKDCFESSFFKIDFHCIWKSLNNQIESPDSNFKSLILFLF